MAKQFERSFSYGPDALNEEERSLSGRRYTRSNSIVGSLWNFLYARHSPEHLQLQGSQDQTDHADTESTRQYDAWLQAYCNGVTIVVLLVAGCICWAVYCVLEPFLRPLLWAVLVGTILHPFKNKWTKRISQWLDGLEGNSIPLSAGLVLSPLFLFNYLSKLLEATVISHSRTILGAALGVVVLWLLYKLSLPLYLYRAVAAVYSFLQNFESFMTYTSPIQLVTVMGGFLLLLIITRSQIQLKYTTALTVLSTLLWFLALHNIAAYLLSNALALPLVTSLFILGGTVSLVTTIRESVGSLRLPVVGREEKEGCSDVDGKREEKREGEEELEGVKCEGEDIDGREEEDGVPTGRDTNLSSPSQREELSLSSQEEVTQSRVSFGPITKWSPERLFSTSEDSQDEGEIDKESPLKKEFSQSDFIFLVLYIMFFITVLWSYPVLLILLVPFAVWSALKRVLFISLSDNGFLSRVLPFSEGLWSWVGTRQSLFLPSPIPTLVRLYLLWDSKVLAIAKGSVNSLMSAFIIFGLLVSGLALTVFLVLQIQVELSHYVAMMAAVWDRAVTSNPQLADWLGGGEGNQSFHDTVESFASQYYMYGREWLAGQVQSMVGDTSRSVVEKQILNLYDQLYQSYVVSNVSSLSVDHTPEVEHGDLLNELKIIVTNNYETIISLLKSVWAILSGNLSLALSLIYTILGLLLSGGTALINTVVFLTTLFYLLCYSEDVYLPVKVVLDVLPTFTQSDTAGHYTASFSRAIRSVFHASMGRFLFYGLYTWLVHTAFGLPVSILPAVLAAVAGALPFIGPYWIALPAILELWLVEGQPLSAIGVLVLSLLPLFLVDSIIYGEIEGGHPYLTGLAVAGGIYFSGLEGALFGPILLCCLVFIHELFGELFTHT